MRLWETLTVYSDKHLLALRLGCLRFRCSEGPFAQTLVLSRLRSDAFIL
jgi:hypothetical protein